VVAPGVDVVAELASAAGADEICGANGSFVGNTPKETSCPSFEAAGRTSVLASSPLLGALVAAPATFGIAIDPADPVLVVVVLATAGGGFLFIIFMIEGTSYAATARNRTPPIAAAIFARFSRCLIVVDALLLRHR